MKIIASMFLVIIALNFGYGQTEKIFDIKESIVKNIFKRKSKHHLKNHNINFFEDEKYICSKFCLGEFGGKIIFKNKKSGIETSFEATCPVVVNKIKNKYYVTNTLAHMCGVSKVLEIDTNLSVKIIVDASWILTLTSFTYNEQLYHIIIDRKDNKTYIAKIENNKFVNLDLISNIGIWTYDPEVFYMNDNHIVVFFKNHQTKGYIEIFNNKINLIRYK